MLHPSSLSRASATASRSGRRGGRRATCWQGATRPTTESESAGTCWSNVRPSMRVNVGVPYICMCVCVHMHVCVCVCVCVCVLCRVGRSSSVCMRASVCVCRRAYTDAPRCVYIFACIPPARRSSTRVLFAFRVASFHLQCARRCRPSMPPPFPPKAPRRTTCPSRRPSRTLPTSSWRRPSRKCWRPRASPARRQSRCKVRPRPRPGRLSPA